MRIKIKQGPVTLNFHLTVILWWLTQLILTEGQSCEEALSHGRGTSEKSVIAETHTTVTTDKCQSAWCVHDTVPSVFSEKSGHFLQFILKLEKGKDYTPPLFTYLLKRNVISFIIIFSLSSPSNQLEMIETLTIITLCFTCCSSN